MPISVPIAEAARLLGVSVDTVKRRIAANQLPARREQRPQGYRWIVDLPDDVLTQAEQADDGHTVDSDTAVQILRAEIRRLEEMVHLMSIELEEARREKYQILRSIEGLKEVVRASLEHATVARTEVPTLPLSVEHARGQRTVRSSQRGWWPLRPRRQELSAGSGWLPPEDPGRAGGG
jgi:hypothetical protein